VVVKTIPPLKINQFLYGYDDGHRLILSSETLPPESARLLLMLSDLARGVTFQKSDSYWTGFPLPEIKAYALLKTWDAPEMSRPGCVWSHALIISFTDLARIKDLSVLKSLFRKPDIKSKTMLGYEEVLNLPPDLFMQEILDNDSTHSEEILKLLHIIYDDDGQFLLENNLWGDIHESVWFSVWSQQWPKIRREFVFRTSGYISLKYFPELEFLPNAVVELPSSYWMEAAYEDIVNIGKFREFLWRYGSDLENGRQYFKVLAYLYQLSSEPFSETNFPKKSLFVFLYALIKAFPNSFQASVIKSDIANLGEDPFSKLPKIKPFDLIEFYVTEPASQSLEPLSESVYLKLENSWDKWYSDILRLTEKALSKKSVCSARLVSVVLNNINAEQFLNAAWQMKNIRSYILYERPEMILDGNLEELHNDELTFLVEKVKHTSNNLERLINKLLKLNNDKTTDFLLQRYPVESVRFLTKEFIDKLESNSDSIFKNADLIKSSADEILGNGLIEHSRYTSTLYAFLNLFGFDNKHIYENGSLPWARALKGVEDNLQLSDQMIFFTYLLMLALKRPAKGCEVIFEYAFIPIHNLIWYGKLNEIALELIFSNLPEVDGVEHWDLCRRLRKSMSKVFVVEELNRLSLSTLLNSSQLLTKESQALKPFKSESKKKKVKVPNKVKKRFWHFFE
jgi:hypothetical protein